MTRENLKLKSVWWQRLSLASLLLASGAVDAAIVRTEPGSDRYSVVALTEFKDVSFKWCDVAEYPKTDCRPKWTAIGLARDLFDAKTKLAAEFDATAGALKKQVANLEGSSIPQLNAEAAQVTRQIEESQKQVNALQASIDRINGQIQAAQQRLKEPNLGANDKKEIESFIKESQTTASTLAQTQAKENSKIARNREQLAYYQKEWATAQKTLKQAQKDLEDRLKELAEAAARVSVSLDSDSTLISYKNESLYFVAALAFSTNVTPMSECKVTGFVLPDGLGRANVTIELKSGQFPLTANTFGPVVQLRSSQNALTVVYTEKSWLHTKNAFWFPNPYKVEETIGCNAPETKVPADFFYAGRTARYYYAGRFKRGAIHSVCKAIANNYAPSGDQFIFGVSDMLGWQKDDLLALQRHSLIQRTLVEGLAPLKKGYYAWANNGGCCYPEDQGEQFFDFTNLNQRPEREWTKSAFGAAADEVELPTICSRSLSM